MPYKGHISEIDAKVIVAMSECGMHTQDAADKLHYARQTVNYHLKRIHRITGKNPRCYFDLCELLEMVNEEFERNDND